MAQTDNEKVHIFLTVRAPVCKAKGLIHVFTIYVKQEELLN